MPTATFDTHRVVQRLKASGFNEQQAEALAEAFLEAHGDAELATRSDIDHLRGDFDALRRDVANDVAALRRDLDLVKAENRKDLAETKADLM